MTQTSAPLRIPDSMGPADIGPYMRSVREYFKLSPQDVSERLHIRVRYVTAIEEGQFDAMPGKVYARGYLHTYAEFLGLDADQVVEQCFKAVARETATPATPTFVPKPLPTTAAPAKSGLGRSLWLPALIVILGFVVYTQLISDQSEEETPVAETQIVQPVAATVTPEALMPYEVVMPTARNYECLTSDDSYLTCFFSQKMVTDLAALDISANSPVAPNLTPPAAAPVKANLSNTSEMPREE